MDKQMYAEILQDASKVGATLTPDREDTYSLTWTAESGYQDTYEDSTHLSLSTVLDRLDVAHVRQVTKNQLRENA